MLSAASVLILQPSPAPTYARYTASTAATVGIRTLKASSTLAISTGRVELGQLNRGDAVDAEVLSVRNTSSRPLPLSVRLTGVPGLSVTVVPALLGPGESGKVRLLGWVPRAGGIHADLQITAFRGFFVLDLPVRGVVRAAAPATPPTIGRKSK